MAKRDSPTPLYITLGILAALVLGLIWSRPVRFYERFTERQPTIDLVVSRYKESLDWLEAYKDYPIRRLYIYNKSDQPIQCPKGVANWECRIANLPNVGVCDHTYLYHILTTYNSQDAADITVFLPASAATSELKRPKIAKILDAAKEGKPSMSGYRPYNGNTVAQEIGDFYLNEWTVSDQKNRDPNANFSLVKADTRPFGAWYQKYFPHARTTTISLMGMFAVTKEMIQKHPINLYRSLLKTVDKDKFPEAAHYVERSWGTLFDTIRNDDLF